MSLQLRRGSQSALDGITPDAGEPIVILRPGGGAGLAIGDGSTQGGTDVSGDMRRADYDSVGDGVVNAARSVAWEGVTNKPLAGFPPASHSHAISDVAGLQDALDSLGGGGSPHTHPIADITGLQSALDGKAATSHTHTIANVTGLQSALDGKAATSHTHAIANVTGLQSALDGKASTSHAHAISDVTGLQAALDTAGSGVHRDLGSVTGTATLDMAGASNLTAVMTLAAGVTLAPTNVPAGALAALTIRVQQPSTGGRTVTYPANTTFLGGGNGSINLAPNSVSIITLVSSDGGSSYLAAVSDTRPYDLDPILINPAEDSVHYFTYPFPTTVELSQAVARGTGNATYARSTGGSFTNVSGSVTLAAGDVLRVTVAGFDNWYTLAIPRSA